MTLATKKFQVTRIKHQSDDAMFGRMPVSEKNSSVVLKEYPEKQNEGDSITIISRDGSLDGYHFELGKVYKISLVLSSTVGEHEAKVDLGDITPKPGDRYWEADDKVEDPAFLKLSGLPLPPSNPQGASVESQRKEEVAESHESGMREQAQWKIPRNFTAPGSFG